LPEAQLWDYRADTVGVLPQGAATASRDDKPVTAMTDGRLNLHITHAQ
jgi:hypothetical protein